MKKTNNYQNIKFIQSLNNSVDVLTFISNINSTENIKHINNKHDITSLNFEILNDKQNLNKTIYALISTSICLNNTNNIIYGICAIQNGKIADYVLDLSVNYEQILSLINLCNEEELELVHFRDVIQDFLWVREIQ